MKSHAQKLLLLLGIALISYGCVQIGQLTAKLLTSSTSDLEEVSMQIRYIRNLWPRETKTFEVDYFEEWRAGRNALAVQSYKRDGVGLWKLDGTVTSNGTAVPYIDNGAHGKFIDDLQPQKINIQTSSGQQIDFTVGPIEPVEITSVNEGSDEIDLTKDLVLEFDEPASNQNKNMRLTMLMNIMGVQTWTPVVHFKAAEKVTIPAEAFKNMPGIKPNSGESYIMIERYRVEPTRHDGIGAAQVLSLSHDTRKVTVKNKVKLMSGIEAKGKIEDEDGTMNYTASKPNAFLGKPMNEAKKFALTSLTVRATQLKQKRTESSSSTNYYGSYKVTTTTTRTETRQFPKLPDIFWDNLIESTYRDVVATLQNNYNIELIPIEQVTSSPSYDELESIDDEITEVAVSKSYKNTKNLIPTTLAAIIGSASSTFASDRVDARLIEELGVDGLIAVTIDLEMPWEEFSLTPRMSFRISGAPNGYIYGPTIFAQGVIHGNGVELDEAKQKSEIGIDVLDKVVRRKQMIRAFDKSLKELKKVESQYAYDDIWTLQ